MSKRHDDCHGRARPIAQSGVGAVSVCPCGVVTLTLQYLSLRLEPDAFHALVSLVLQAQTRLAAADLPAGSPWAGADEAEAAPPPPHGVH